MSTENFDKKIKAKLDSLEPAFQEQDWQNFSPLLHPKKPFWLRFRKPFVLGIATTTLFFLIYKNHQLSIENKELHHKVSNIAEKSTTFASGDSQKGINLNPKSNTNTFENQALNESKNEKKDISVKEKQNVFQNTIEKVGKTNTPSLKERIVENKDKNTFDISSKSNENTPKLEVPKAINTTSLNPQISKNIQNELTKNEQTQALTSSISSEEVQAINIQKKTRLIENINLLDYQWLVKSNNDNKPINSPEKVFISPKIIKPKPSYYKFGIGLNSVVRDDIVSAGLTLAFQPIRNLQITSGFDILKGFEDEFRDNGEFKKRFNSDFKDKFPKPFPKDTYFKDIHSKKVLFTIPLNINYQIPVWKKLAVFTEVGTSFVLHSREVFDYKYSDNGANFELSDSPLKVVNHSNLIQNATTSVGLQYQWRRYQIRVAPNYSFNFQKRGSAPDEIEHNLGLKFQALYFWAND